MIVKSNLTRYLRNGDESLPNGISSIRLFSHTNRSLVDTSHLVEKEVVIQ